MKDSLGSCKYSQSKAKEMAEMGDEGLWYFAKDLKKCLSIVVYLIPI